MKAYIGLGSNLDDPMTQVQTAITELAVLPDSRLIAQSALYQSAAVGPGEQPDYINAVVCLETSLAAEPLLDALQAIEQAHRRVRREHWGPRTLDLDILLYGNQVINTPRLQVPHPWLERRNFVLLPLADVAPGLTLPNGTTVQALLQKTSRTGITQIST